MTRCDGEFKQEKYHRQERDASKGGAGERGDRGAATIRCSTSRVAVKDASRRTLIVRADRSNTQVLERRNQTLSRMILHATALTRPLYWCFPSGYESVPTACGDNFLPDGGASKGERGVGGGHGMRRYRFRGLDVVGHHRTTTVT
jgi:hypothetical protein